VVLYGCENLVSDLIIGLCILLRVYQSIKYEDATEWPNGVDSVQGKHINAPTKQQYVTHYDRNNFYLPSFIVIFYIFRF
jgi:hypothetical protein